ncbi:hypothetical protein CWD77_14545 [Rhodohalobacter barkolensis]|uniref:Uncharacterized protein n=1 Tax=Rhodohalobacter barkolensis TaxID=2053187 RepID=A0A2N0VEJ7_9BACT|nr:hypothetical protein CWD77_14545 [Rhodohalobacter barkolensis]
MWDDVSCNQVIVRQTKRIATQLLIDIMLFILDIIDFCMIIIESVLLKKMRGSNVGAKLTLNQNQKAYDYLSK